MKKILLFVLMLIFLNSVIFARELTHARRSMLYQGGVEAGIVTGPIYNNVTDNPFQFGFRAGICRFVSQQVAIGGGTRISFLPFGNSIDAGLNLGIGPEIIISGGAESGRHAFFAGFHAHFSRLKAAGGVEVGVRVGGMTLPGGTMYGLGVAYGIMHNNPDGTRIYLTIGGAGSGVKSR